MRIVDWPKKLTYANDLWPGPPLPCRAGLGAVVTDRTELVDFCCALAGVAVVHVGPRHNSDSQTQTFDLW